MVSLNKQHQRTLNAIFSTPVPSALEWRRIESLFSALGAKTVERGGARVLFELNEVGVVFHRPHPQKEAKQYQVRRAQRFLQEAGITPWSKSQ